MDTSPPTYEGLNLLPTYDDACNLPSLVAENQSVGTTLTSQITNTSRETNSTVLGPFVNGVPKSLTTSQYWVAPSSSSETTVQDSRTSANNGVSNSDDCKLFGVLTIGEGERPQHVPKKNIICRIIAMCILVCFYGFVFILLLRLLLYSPNIMTMFMFPCFFVIFSIFYFYCILCSCYGNNNSDYCIVSENSANFV